MMKKVREMEKRGNWEVVKVSPYRLHEYTAKETAITSSFALGEVFVRPIRLLLTELQTLNW
jgi:hypothetical protein